MTPYGLDILLFYYCRGGDHPDMDRNPPVWEPTINQFKVDGLLMMQIAGGGSLYALTARGRAYIDALLSVPYPEPCWFMRWPREDRIEA